MGKAQQKIKVLHIVSRLHLHQGPVSQLYNLIKYMDKQTFSNAILTLSSEPKDSRSKMISDLDIELYSPKPFSGTGILFGRRHLAKFLQKYPVDIIHASDMRSSLMAALAPRNIPRIITRRETFYKARIIEFGIVRGTIIEAVHSAACRQVDKVVAVSQFVRRAASRTRKIDIDVIQNGVDMEKFTPVSDDQRRKLKNRLRLPQDKRIFITAGFLSRIKDPFNIIKGFLASKVSEQSLLLFLGDGPLRRECELLANGHPNIRFIGFVDNVAEYLQASDFFVLGSLFEGCPNAVLEAMSCGLPVILSDIGAHNEIMELNSQSGKLFKTKNPGSLAKRMEEIVDDDYTLLKNSALSIAREHLNARRMSIQYEKLYKNLHYACAGGAER